MLDLINVSYDTQIPNNVGLSQDKKVLKALEKWHPGYINWWNDLIPQQFQESMVYLRTAVSVDPKGWAKFDYVKMPEYRWGVLLAPAVEDRKIPMGEHLGEPAAADRLMRAVDKVCTDGIMTPDVGGTANTQDVTDAVCEAIRSENI